MISDSKSSDTSSPGSHASPLLDDEIGDSSGLNSDVFSLDAPNAFGQAVSNYNNTFNAAGSSLVLYSSDVNISPGHAPEVFMAAGGPPGSSSGGATTTSGSTLVSSSTGMSINITWDSSVSSAPLEFKNVVLQVAQYFVNY